jgi:hypothetical protein
MTPIFKISSRVKMCLAATAALLMLSSKAGASEDNLVLLQNLKGNWQFSIGINDEWISPKFDDSKWESIKVPSPWEDQGFNGYNGYAFYRKKFNISSSFKGRTLYLNMGYIDDVDEVYLNGHKIGSSGSFPPNYNTAYNAERVYYIPEEYIIFDAQNLIAVKVYDSYQVGGIVSGEIGLYGGKASADMLLNLQSTWKFQTGDDMRRKESDYNDSNWGEIIVPAKWEDQGYRDYDGYAWYRKSFTPQFSGNEKLVLLMGKIDDIDQVYINGVLVGSTGKLPKWGDSGDGAEGAYDASRGYYIPDGVIKNNQKNVIAVRVLDTGGDGGIYEGPVGFITQSKYIEYWRKMKKNQD